MAKVANVNTTDIAAAIRLGCRTMGNVFDADDGDTPFFRSVVRPDARLAFSDSFSEAHVPGRHLNALLAAEHVLGVVVPEEVVAKHARAAFFSYGGPLPLPLNRAAVGGPVHRFLPHNVREGFHALYALARFRDSARAREVAEASIATIDRIWDPERGWDRRELEERHGLALVEWDAPFISGLARAIGPLTKYHAATGSPAALALARRLAAKALAEGFGADGAYDLGRLGRHTHSITCTMSSLAQLAELTGDRAMLDRVRLFFDRGLRDIADDLGWSIENGAPEANPDRGEANNTGDILETALILGRLVDPAYLHRAERILRGHLLPCQLRDVSFIQDPPNSEGIDGKHDVAARHLGAFGFPAPYGHAPLGYPEVSFNMDIVGGAVGSLCAAHDAAVRRDGEGWRVDLLFDRAQDGLVVRSPYPDGMLEVRAERGEPVTVRIPPWADRAALPGSLDAGDLRIAPEAAARGVRIPLPLVDTELVLAHRTRHIRTRLRGDAVVAMENVGAVLTFFDEL